MCSLKVLVRSILGLLTAAVLCIAVSALTEREYSEVIFTFLGLRITVTGIGAAVSFLAMLLFASFRTAGLQRRNVKDWFSGERLDALGFVKKGAKRR